MLPLQPNLCVQWTSPVLLSLLCVECPLMSSQASWGQYSGPRRGNTLSSHLARLVRGFIDAGSAGRKAVSQPAPPRGAFPVSLRWSHHYSQVITGPVTWLLLQDCHPWHPSSAHRAWERAPSAGTDRAVSKCKTDILMTWKRGCSLSPPYSLSKLVTAPMRSHFHFLLCFLFMKYHSGFLSVDSRFLEALCLHFKGTQR